MSEDSLASIDRKLSAIIALLTLQMVSEEPRGIESILRRAGMSSREVASILGNSQRSVQMALQAQGFKE